MEYKASLKEIPSNKKVSSASNSVGSISSSSTQKENEKDEKIYRDSLVPLENSKNYKMSTIEDYVTIFRNGFSLNEGATREKQMAFVHSNMKNGIQIRIPDVEIDLLQQWSIASATMADLNFQLKDVNVVGSDGSIIRCHSHTTFRITRRFIATLYPHMLADEEFVSSVVGKTMSLIALLHFKYTEENPSEIAVIEAESFMLQAWLSLLKGDSKKADEVVNGGALITSSGLIETDEIVDVSDDEEDDHVI